MIILRQTPFPLSVSYEGLEPSTNYSLNFYDNDSTLLFQYDVTSDSSGVISQELDKYFEKFDEEYAVYVYSLDVEGNPQDTVVMDNLYVKRPYVNPFSIGDTYEEDSEAEYNERIARSIIDTITDGFYYTHGTIETVGMGGDYLAIPDRINRINYVYRNNILVYDRFAAADVVQDQFVITPDYTAITIKQDGIYNRSQSKPVTLPLAASDSFNLYNDSDDPIAALTKVREFDLFPQDYDYTVVGEFGYPVVPLDIQEATKLLINDISCNNLSYINKYINEYKTDQFTIKYNELAWSGTGNRIVDEILKKYTTSFSKIGVL